jgi:hypothetical protein
VNPVDVMVVHVIAEQPEEMRFIQRDHMIQQLPAATSDPAFGDSVLPRCPRARLLGLQPGRLQERLDVATEF